MATLNFDATKVRPHEGFADDINQQPRDTSRKWSTYQENIFSFVADRNAGNGVVIAVAGSGKSTTIVEAMKLASGESIFLAFNKSIADELKARGVNARTFHSLVFGPVMRFYKQQNPSTSKLNDLTRENWSWDRRKLYGAFAQRLVGLARGMGIGVLIADTTESWVDLADHHNLEPESDNADFGEAIEAAQELFVLCNLDARVDFDDMLYRAVRDNINLPKFDFVFVDEAQDTNPIQRAVLRMIMHARSRLVAVGDPAQAIYGFRGADSDSLDSIVREFNCTQLPLSITYRCPTSVVTYAQQWVGHIQAADNASEGIVEELDKWDPSFFQAGDLVVCRKTAPLITTAFKFIRAQVPVTVMGREIGQGLKTLIKKMEARNVDELADKLEQFRSRELMKLAKKEEEQRMEALNDKVDTILYMIDGLQEGKRTIEWLEKGIDWLFADKGNAVVFATIHKSKGLEADRVFWLGRGECPARWAKRGWQYQQELNLCYVATTRAKKALYLIEEQD